MNESVRRAVVAALSAHPPVRVIYTDAITSDSFYLTPRSSGAVLFINSQHADSLAPHMEDQAQDARFGRVAFEQSVRSEVA